MKVQSMSLPGVAGPGRNANSASPAGNCEPRDAFNWKAGAWGVGGAAAGVAGSLVAAAAVNTTSAFIGTITAGALPNVGVSAPAWLTSAGHLASLGGLALGAAAGLAAGVAIAYQAGNGARHVDVAKLDPHARVEQGPVQTFLAKHQDNAADLRLNLKQTAASKSFSGAIGHGFEAAAALGGPTGAAAGQIQGALLGFALGGLAGVPLMALVHNPLVLLPTALMGGFAGAKAGEPLGYAAGAVVAGGVGALGGALGHAAQKLTGH